MFEVLKTLPIVVSELGADAVALEAIVFAIWRKVAGELLAEHTAPLEFADSRLTIAVTSETWRKHLEDLSGQMLYRMNAALGESTVTFIEFRVDESAVNESHPRRAKPQIADAELEKRALKQVTPELRAAAKSIADRDLRQKFLLAAGSALDRKLNNSPA